VQLQVTLMKNYLVERKRQRR